MKDIMLDIETLSTDSNAAVLSISAVQFDLQTGDVGSEFEIALKLGQQQLNGAVIDGDTVMWWFNQEDKAIKSITSMRPVGVGNALDQFNEWIENLGPKLNDMNLWGNGSNFDCVITRNLYKRQGKKFILPYWCDKDVRTVVNLLDIDTRDYAFKGVKHNGIDDCKHQINYCCGGSK